MSKYTEFFFNSQSNITMLDLLEISHPSFSQTFRLVRNHTSGVTVITENDEELTFDFYPFEIESDESKGNLDYSITINLGDLGELLPSELDNIFADDSFNIAPEVIYRTYRSDDLTEPLFVRKTLKVKSFAFTKYGSTFQATSDNLNKTGTGEIMTFDRFPMMRDSV